jgi:YegS/Rv2252/BmrU family lipid kinase
MTTKRSLRLVVNGKAAGDGTINEVVNGVLQADPSPRTAVAAAPYGTANDFATACGIPTDDTMAALQLAAGGEARPIDVGKVNDRFFINVASGGFGAEVTASTPIEMKKALGGAAYSIRGPVTAVKMTPYQGKLVTPEGEERGSMIVMAVGNGLQCGGGFQMTPKALLDDGLLELNLDGEPVQGTEFQFDVLARRLPFVLPAAAPLVTREE